MIDCCLAGVGMHLQGREGNVIDTLDERSNYVKK